MRDRIARGRRPLWHSFSCAQNFEDITLWRALQFFPGGFYIDVGANDPNHDSVTRAYYERGWRGIDIDPVDAYYQALCRERPEDTNLQLVAGKNEGQVTFHEFPNTGLSTASDEMVAMYEAAGIKLNSREGPMRTLASICEEHVNGEIQSSKSTWKDSKVRCFGTWISTGGVPG